MFLSWLSFDQSCSYWTQPTGAIGCISLNVKPGSCEIKQMCRHVQSEDQQAGNAMFLGFRMAVNLTQTGEHGGPIMHASRLLSTDSIPSVHKDWLEFTETPGRDPQDFLQAESASSFRHLWFEHMKDMQKPSKTRHLERFSHHWKSKISFWIGWQQQLIADLSLKETREDAGRFQESAACSIQAYPGCHGFYAALDHERFFMASG